MLPLPKLTPEGNRVWIYRLNKLPSDYQFNPHDAIKCGSIILDICQKYDSFRSIILILDYENINPAIVPQLIATMKDTPWNREEVSIM